MATIENDASAIHVHSPAEETEGRTILKWGALVALIVETILVLGGITTATILR
jgi:hypothetical protein